MGNFGLKVLRLLKKLCQAFLGSFVGSKLLRGVYLSEAITLNYFIDRLVFTSPYLVLKETF